MKKNENSLIEIYQSENGSLELSIDDNRDTIWATQMQISQIFGRERSVITKHLRTIFKSGELDEKSNVQKMHIINSKKPVILYNLDVILSVGYRVNSKNATKFRQWATSVLHRHIVDGWTINKNRIKSNYDNFIKAMDDIKALLPNDNKISNSDVFELIKNYANTWFSLDAYDKDNLIQKGKTNETIELRADDLLSAINELKAELIKKNETTKLFATEREKGNVESIFNNIMQIFDGIELYPSVEEKSANLLYFMVKNHPFVDGNKRSGAYSFIWFLQKNKILNFNRITPEALTSLTLLIIPPAKIITYHKFFHKIPISTSKYFVFSRFCFRSSYKSIRFPNKNSNKTRLFCINYFLKEKLFLHEVYCGK